MVDIPGSGLGTQVSETSVPAVTALIGGDIVLLVAINIDPMDVGCATIPTVICGASSVSSTYTYSTSRNLHLILHAHEHDLVLNFMSTHTYIKHEIYPYWNSHSKALYALKMSVKSSLRYKTKERKEKYTLVPRTFCVRAGSTWEKTEEKEEGKKRGRKGGRGRKEFLTRP